MSWATKLVWQVTMWCLYSRHPHFRLSRRPETKWSALTQGAATAIMSETAIWPYELSSRAPCEASEWDIWQCLTECLRGKSRPEWGSGGRGSGGQLGQVWDSTSARKGAKRTQSTKHQIRKDRFPGSTGPRFFERNNKIRLPEKKVSNWWPKRVSTSKVPKQRATDNEVSNETQFLTRVCKDDASDPMELWW